MVLGVVEDYLQSISSIITHLFACAFSLFAFKV